MHRLLTSLLPGLLAFSRADANLLAYDPFLDGGAAPDPGAGEYRSQTDYPDNFVAGQAPTAVGFSAEPWASGGQFSSAVYYRAEAVSLAYLDGAGDALVTAGGQMNLFRSSGNSATDKDLSRPLAIGGSLPETLYISLLASVSAGDSLTLRSAASDGVSARRFNFGINAAGNPFVTGTLDGNSSANTNSGLVVAPDAPLFLVARLRNGGTTQDEIALFLNPLLADEGLNTPVATVSTGNFYVSGQANWTLLDIFFRNRVVDAPSSVRMDEIRIGSTWASVTPHVAVPEPTTAALLALGALALRRPRS
jgi:hypothetical protein